MIESLTRQGIDTYLLSGDKRSAAEYVASAVGIPRTRVRLLHKIPFLVAHILPTLGRIVHIIFWARSVLSNFCNFYQVTILMDGDLVQNYLVLETNSFCYYGSTKYLNTNQL